jgi:uncharacterized membrane protein HdeD (DUF308 family)
MTDHAPLKTSSGRPMAFWITLARSVLATALGLALILQPEKTRPMLVNFMGMFWLMAGIMSLRWGANGERARRVSVVAGIIGITAGVLVLARFLILNVLGEEVVAAILGALIIMIGLVHIFEGFRTGADRQRQRSWTSTLLGVFEIGLGGVVLTWREEFGPGFYIIATIWAFLGAFVLLREAFGKRKAMRATQREEDR